jgi:ubiquinone biosynthesis monooxygenase Coq7
MRASLVPPGIDDLIGHVDRALRTLAGVHRAERASPAAGIAESGPDELDADARAEALYQGQALTAREPRNRDALAQAAREEQDHLVWSADRIGELGGHASLLNPLWYGGALGLGAAAGLFGDRWSLAFLAETERQVEEHLSGHLDRLPAADRKTRAVVEAMRDDEARHRDSAIALGAAELPAPLKAGMRAMARVMTTIAYRL